MTDKPTNQKDAVGVGKMPMSCLPSVPAAEVATAMFEGARKYGRHNWRKAGVRSSIYYDAAMRHLMAWWEGEDIDPDSRMPHIVKAMAGLMVLRDAQVNGQETDDRPPAADPEWQDDLNEAAQAIIARFPAPADPVTQESLDAPVEEHPRWKEET